jgi:hypothetical protein
MRKIQTIFGLILKVSTASNWTPHSQCRKHPIIIDDIQSRLMASSAECDERDFRR